MKSPEASAAKATYEGSPSYRQRKKDKEELRDITHKLQTFVEKKKQTDAEVKLLHGKIATLEADHKRRRLKLQKEYEKKIEEIRRQQQMQQQENESMQLRLESAMQISRNCEIKMKAAKTDSYSYEKQLTDLEKKLSDANASREKAEAQLNRVLRLNKQRDEEISSLRQTNSTLTLRETEIKTRLTGSSDEMQKLKEEVTLLNRRLMKAADHHSLELLKARQKAEDEKDDLQRGFKDQLEEFCKLKMAQYDKDKKCWMEIFRAEVETKMRGLKEDNQSLVHTVKVLEEDNEQLTSKVSELQTKCEQATKSETRALQIKDMLQIEYEDSMKLNKANIDKLTREAKRMKRENDKMKEVLSRKDERLLQLEREHCDYFQEINQLQQVLATAEDTRSPSVQRSPVHSLRTTSTTYKEQGVGQEGSRVENPRPRKKRRLEFGAEPGMDNNGGTITTTSTKYWSSGGGQGGKSSMSKTTTTTTMRESSTQSCIRTSRSNLCRGATGKENDAEQDEDLPGPALGFSCVDVDQGFIVVKNLSDHDVNLKGYHLTNDTKPRCRQDLPNRTLKPKQEIRVVFGEEFEESKENGGSRRPDDVYWENGVWANEKDAAILWDNNQEMLACYRIEHDTARKKCHIM